MVNRTGVEVHVHVDSPVPVGSHHVFGQVGENLEPAGVAALFAQRLGAFPQVTRARVLGPVHAVAEPHDALAVVQLVTRVLFRVLGVADFYRHLHYFFGGAAVGRAFQRTHRAGDGGVQRRVG